MLRPTPPERLTSLMWCFESASWLKGEKDIGLRNPFEKWKNPGWLGCVGGFYYPVRPSYKRILINHYTDPYEPTSIMDCHILRLPGCEWRSDRMECHKVLILAHLFVPVCWMIPKVIGHVKLRQIPPLFCIKVDTLRRAVEKEQAEIATLHHGSKCKLPVFQNLSMNETILISVGGNPHIS